MLLSNKFKSAASDYLFLLQKNYPQGSILKVVGDKYQLTGQAKAILDENFKPDFLNFEEMVS